MLYRYFKDCWTSSACASTCGSAPSVEEAVFDEKTGTWQVHIKTAEGKSETIVAERRDQPRSASSTSPRFPTIKGRESFPDRNSIPRAGATSSN